MAKVIAQIMGVNFIPDQQDVAEFHVQIAISTRDLVIGAQIPIDLNQLDSAIQTAIKQAIVQKLQAHGKNVAPSDVKVF